jgi:hypothetical protein
MFIEIVAILLPVLAGVIIAGVVGRRLSPPRHVAAIALAAALGVGVAAVYNLGLVRMPFLGWASEGPLLVATALALVPAIVMFQLLAPDVPGRRGDATNRWRGGSPLMVLFIVPIGMVILPWTVRIEAARKRAWACDGAVVSKYRSHNHSAPALVVDSAAGPVTLDGVDAGLWETVHVGDRLVKQKLSEAGTLNGRPVRVVPPWALWGNETQARRGGAE